MPFGAISCNGMKGSCFPKNTRVLTNRGYVFIQDIDIIHDTINGQPIIALVSDIQPITYMVLIKSNTFKPNVPTRNVLLDSNCKVKIDTDIYSVKNCIDGSRIVMYRYKGYGYNLILEGSRGMIVNNMLTETLNANNDISKYIISQILDIAAEKAQIKIKDDNISSKLLESTTS